MHYYPQDGYERRNYIAQEEKAHEEAVTAAYWEAVEASQKEEWIYLQELIAEGRAEEAVFWAAEMEEIPIVFDERNDCPTFQMAKWLEWDGFFKAKIYPRIEWQFTEKWVIGYVKNTMIVFWMRQTEGKPEMVLQIGGLRFAFTANFTATLKSLMEGQDKYNAHTA